MSKRGALIAGWLIVVSGFGFVVIHYYEGSPGDPEGWYASFGFGAPFVGAGCLGLIGVQRRRPSLAMVAGVVLFPMSLLSFVLLPMVIAAGVLIAWALSDSGEIEKVVVPILLALCLLGAMVMLVFNQDPIEWMNDDGFGGSSNFITSLEATVSLVTTFAVVGLGIVWSRPNRA